MAGDACDFNAGSSASSLDVSLGGFADNSKHRATERSIHHNFAIPQRL
jgi:hypothetical protein